MGAGLVGCNPAGDHCGTNVVSTQPNPENGKNNFSGFNAQVITKDCGATVGWITAVRLVDLENNPFPNSDGVVFAYYHGRPKINISWRDWSHLLISCPECKAENITVKTVVRSPFKIEYTQ